MKAKKDARRLGEGDVATRALWIEVAERSGPAWAEWALFFSLFLNDDDRRSTLSTTDYNDHGQPSRLKDRLVLTCTNPVLSASLAT